MVRIEADSDSESEFGGFTNDDVNTAEDRSKRARYDVLRARLLDSDSDSSDNDLNVNESDEENVCLASLARRFANEGIGDSGDSDSPVSDGDSEPEAEVSKDGWSTQVSTALQLKPAFHPRRETGPATAMAADQTPLNFFNLLFTEEMLL